VPEGLFTRSMEILLRDVVRPKLEAILSVCPIEILDIYGVSCDVARHDFVVKCKCRSKQSC
jgi:hypothetical protein